MASPGLRFSAKKPFEVTAASAFALANILHGGRQHIHTVWQTGVAPALVEHIRVDVCVSACTSQEPPC